MSDTKGSNLMEVTTCGVYKKLMRILLSSHVAFHVLIRVYLHVPETLNPKP